MSIFRRRVHIYNQNPLHNKHSVEETHPHFPGLSDGKFVSGPPSHHTVFKCHLPSAHSYNRHRLYRTQKPKRREDTLYSESGSTRYQNRSELPPFRRRALRLHITCGLRSMDFFPKNIVNFPLAPSTRYKQDPNVGKTNTAEALNNALQQHRMLQPT